MRFRLVHKRCVCVCVCVCVCPRARVRQLAEVWCAQRTTTKKDINATVPPRCMRVTVHAISDISTSDKIQVPN